MSTSPPTKTSSSSDPLARSSHPPGPIGDAEHFLAVQRVELPDVLQELKTDKQKTGHWIWWVFAQRRRPRSSDWHGIAFDGGDEEVREGIRHALVGSSDSENSSTTGTLWREVLEEIVMLIQNAVIRFDGNGNETDAVSKKDNDSTKAQLESVFPFYDFDKIHRFVEMMKLPGMMPGENEKGAWIRPVMDELSKYDWGRYFVEETGGEL